MTTTPAVLWDFGLSDAEVQPFLRGIMTTLVAVSYQALTARVDRTLSNHDEMELVSLSTTSSTAFRSSFRTGCEASARISPPQ